MKPGDADATLTSRARCLKLVAFDFDGVFTDNMVYTFEDGTEAVRCFRGDGIGVQGLQQAGIATVIISSEKNPVVAARSRKLGMRCVQGVADKRSALESLAHELHLSFNQIAFVGNDVNDLGCLSCVGLPIVVRDAHPDLIATALYQTRACGGQGAVREICDLLVRTLAAEDNSNFQRN
jgi:YrbI family 3-deoxy-D-manno-octulosonate 8-phosphate phosphatase